MREVHTIYVYWFMHNRKEYVTHRGVKYPQRNRPTVIPPQKPEVTYPTVLGFAFCEHLSNDRIAIAIMEHTLVARRYVTI
jgi:hypothetical protein